MKKVFIVFGTRPEAVKFAPLIKEIKNHPSLKGIVCVFRQHRKMLDDVLGAFDIKPDYDLKIMISDKSLFAGKINIFKKLYNAAVSGFSFLIFLRVLKKEKPDILLVQGDTSTAFLAAWIAYHFKIKIGHLEAGLRTHDKYAPFPEEMNRQLICRLADLHFAPTEYAKNNLLAENIAPEKIFLTGNTAIDALLAEIEIQKDKQDFYKNLFQAQYKINLASDKKIIIVTAHRRESFGEGLKNIFEAIKKIASGRNDILIVYPVHLNPNVYRAAHETLGDLKNVFLIEPLAYGELIFLMSQSYLILTDSGGIQEEAPSLNKPVLVMREKTERPEGVEAGASKLVGVDQEKITSAVFELLDNKKSYAAMINKKNPYGDGQAAKKIIEAINNYLK